MNINFTRNTLKQNFSFVVVVPNGKLQRELLKADNEVGSNCGLYGLNYNVYSIDGIAFIRGGRPASFIELDGDILARYMDIEKHFNDDTPYATWQERRIERAKLRQQFANDVREWYHAL